MKSVLPKVLQPVCGVPLVEHVLDAGSVLSAAVTAVVVGHGASAVREALAGREVSFVEQTELLGTGDAVRRCREALEKCERVIVLNGDVPLILPETLARLAAAAGASPMAFVSCTMEEPGALGRVGRDSDGRVTGIVEAADWDGPPGAVEVNGGQYALQARWLWENVERLEASPKGEYYLTQLARMAYEQGTPALAVEAAADELLGVDDRVMQAEAERLMRERILRGHMLAGVRVVDPATTYIDAGAQLEADVTLHPNCYVYGATEVAAGAEIGPGTTLRNARIGAGCRVEASVVEDSAVGAGTRVGPFAHVRGGAEIGEDCELGNYAEVKNSVIGRGVKMHHFSYVGDADVGEETNIAAGAITCNYDGVSKHRTTIGRRVFVGCDTMMVAPVTLGDESKTGAGAVVTEDVPPGVTVVGMPARPIGVGRGAGGRDGG